MTLGRVTGSSSTKYPLLYWCTLVYVVGIPNFVHFDPTGRTRNPVNFSSISLVILALMTGYSLAIMLLLDRRGVVSRRIHASQGLWVVLLLVCLVASLLEPQFRGIATSKMDLPLSLFRLGQWTLAFVLFVALYSRTEPRCATQVLVELVGRASWITVSLVWIFLPIIPSQVFGVSEESAGAVRRLGGEFIGPGPLAVIAGIAFFYSWLVFPRGLGKWAGCFLAFVTLVLTLSRIGLAAFLLAVFVYAIGYSRKPLLKWGLIGTLIVAGVVATAFSPKLKAYVARGQSFQTLSTLDDRTRIWQTGLQAVQYRPLLGYGYSVGARNAIRENWKYAHWTPPHAHNDFIEAALDGGVLAAILTFCIYVLALWRGFLQANRGIYQLFLLLAVIQLEMNGILGGLMMANFGSLGAMFLLCYIGLAGSATDRPKQYSKKVPSMRRLNDAPLGDSCGPVRN